MAKRDKSWFEFRNAGERAEISIYDEIGIWGITAQDFKDEMKDLSPTVPIDLFINSPGGDFFAGISIYNMLDRHRGEIVVHVDGIAASIASVIAMVGNRVLMAENSMMMVHNPTSFALGDSREMRKIAEVLDKIKDQIITIYAGKTSKERDDIWDIMDEETWFTAQEAVDEGFADEVSEPVDIANTFDLSKFVHPPAKAGNTQRSHGAPRKHEEDAMSTPEDMTTAPTPAPAPVPTNTVVPPTPAPMPAPAETEAQMRERISNEMKGYRRDVTRACNLAGRPDLIDGFVDEGKPIADVLDALEAASKDKSRPTNRGDNSPSNEVTSRHAPTPETGGENVIDTDAIYAKWNSAGKNRAA